MRIFGAVTISKWVGWIGGSRASVRAKPGAHSPEESSGGVWLSELGRMMPDLVHQFLTPIAAIEGASYVLEQADLSYDKRQEFAAIIRKECRRLELLVQLLDVTQSISGTALSR